MDEITPLVVLIVVVLLEVVLVVVVLVVVVLEVESDINEGHELIIE